ncbi:replication factor C subunit 1 [Cymbomonas tetramitiformis]|uniref:Replication factor C subunit 1 n=1 Tax=Cymbomonas tetramitiformis TaxID=36881 RepID=A0AAE0BUC6_9CHLO|nr:replication factor C subunit 1 [Cymbomonas tetramitiformis]
MEGLQAALLSGPPGIGKTSSAKIIAESLGFETMEINASDTRGKSEKDVEGGVGGRLMNQVREMVTNRSMGLGGIGFKSLNRAKPQVLIMDEVDGMSGSAERGGVADLIQTIKISRIPIICICNDAYKTSIRSLGNHTLDLKFNRPQKPMVAKRMIAICQGEGLEVDQPTMEALVESCNNDIRCLLNTLQLRRRLSTKLSYDEVKAGKAGKKDLDLSAFTVAEQLLGPDIRRLTVGERIDLMFQDADILPLFIQENYIQMRPTDAGNDEGKRMDLIARAADCLGDGDILSLQVRKYQKWQLMPSTNAAFIHAASLVTGRRDTFDQYERNFHRFPTWLGKNSSGTKCRRLLGELHAHSSASGALTANRQSLRLHYLPVLRNMLTGPLRRDGQEGIADVMEIMDAYSFNKDDYESTLELTKFKSKAPMFEDPTKDIPTAVKSAFTRECNKASRHLKWANQAGAKKASAKKGAATEDFGAEEGGEENGTREEGEDEEDEEADKEKKLQKIAKSKLARINFEGSEEKGKGKAKSAAGRAKKPAAKKPAKGKK